MATPAYRKAFREFISSLPGIDDLPAMEQEFYLTPSARAAVLLQASLVEDTLRRMIQAKFVTGMSSDLTSRIFKSNGPISTFGNRIIIGRALGLYGSVFHHDLEIIRELVMHSPTLVTLWNLRLKRWPICVNTYVSWILSCASSHRYIQRNIRIAKP